MPKGDKISKSQTPITDSLARSSEVESVQTSDLNTVQKATDKLQAMPASVHRQQIFNSLQLQRGNKYASQIARNLQDVQRDPQVGAKASAGVGAKAAAVGAELGAKGGGTLSGAAWCSKYQDPKSTDAMNDDVKGDAAAFIAALEAAGASVTINSTVRPPERSYLMYWASKIAFSKDPEAVAKQAQSDPEKQGNVSKDITWSHGNAAKTKQAAQAMVDTYQIGSAVARKSKHNEGGAMDISISWSKKLTITGKNGEKIETKTKSGLIVRDTTNIDKGILAAGKTFGLLNYNGPENAGSKRDAVHWSRSGG